MIQKCFRQLKTLRGFNDSNLIWRESGSGTRAAVESVIPGLRIERMFSWALPSGELGGVTGEFYQFPNSIRSELSAVSVSPLKEAA
jgi:hypothetical protein